MQLELLKCSDDALRPLYRHVGKKQLSGDRLQATTVEVPKHVRMTV